MRKSSLSLIVMGFVAVVAATLAGNDLVMSAQNSNSSTAMSQTEAKPKPTTRRHRRARKPPVDATATDTSAMPATPAPRTGRCDPMQQEQTDLSGTYTGRVNYPEASLSGDATLTITGNNFTLTAGTSTASGRITAVTTCNYTGATMMFGDTTPPDPTKPSPPPLPAVSLRAKKMGNHVMLTSVPGETRSFSFMSGGGRPRTHRPRRRAAAPPPPATPPE